MAGIFHGGELLVEHYMTAPTSESASLTKSAPNLVMLDTNHSSFSWDNDIVFNLKVSDLPRMARLCFSVVGFSGNSGNSKKLSKNQSVAVLAAKPSAKLFWGNINFYDYKGRIVTLLLQPYYLCFPFQEYCAKTRPLFVFGHLTMMMCAMMRAVVILMKFTQSTLIHWERWCKTLPLPSVLC